MIGAGDPIDMAGMLSRHFQHREIYGHVRRHGPEIAGGRVLEVLIWDEVVQTDPECAEMACGPWLLAKTAIPAYRTRWWYLEKDSTVSLPEGVVGHPYVPILPISFSTNLSFYSISRISIMRA
jgi:hypothetical protein